MGRYGISNAWRTINTASGRESVVMLGIYSPGDSSYGSRLYGTWSGAGGVAAISDVSSIGSRFEVSSMSNQVGEITVSLVGQSSTRAIAEIFQQTPDAPRFADVLVGFRPTASTEIRSTDFLCVFRGAIKSVGYSPTETSITISDGSDIVRRAKSDNVLPDSDPFLADMALEHPAKICVDICSAYLTDATQDPDARVRGWLAHPSSQASSGYFSDLLAGFHPVNDRLIPLVLKTKVIGQNDPKQTIDQKLIGPWGAFVRRDSFGYWSLADISPLDKAPTDLLDAPIYQPRKVIGDADIVSVGPASFEPESMVRGVQVDFGLCVWSFWSDVIEEKQEDTDELGAIAPGVRHKGTPVGLMQFSHEFSPWTGNQPSWSGAGNDGRIVSISAPLFWMTEDDSPIDIGQDASIGAPMAENAPGYDEFFSVQDSMGFPVGFRHTGREWSQVVFPNPYPNHGVSVLQSPDVSNRLDECHEIHKTIFRIIRAAGLPHSMIPVEVLSSAGATIAVGDLVTFESGHAVNPSTRRVGFVGSESVAAQVRAKTVSPMGSTVGLTLAVPMLPKPGSNYSRYDGGAPVVEIQPTGYQLASRLQDRSINQWSIFDRARGRGEGPAEARFVDSDGLPTWTADPIHGHRFHYCRYRVKVTADPDRNQICVVRVRVALISTDSGVDKIAASRMLRVGIRPRQTVELTDSIFAPAVPGFDAGDSTAWKSRGEAAQIRTIEADRGSDQIQFYADRYPGDDRIGVGDVLKITIDGAGPFFATLDRVRVRDYKGDPWTWEISKLPLEFWERFGENSFEHGGADFPENADGSPLAGGNKVTSPRFEIMRPVESRIDESVQEGRPYLSPVAESLPGRDLSPITSIRLAIDDAFVFSTRSPSGSFGTAFPEPEDGPELQDIRLEFGGPVELWRHSFSPESGGGPIVEPPQIIRERER